MRGAAARIVEIGGQFDTQHLGEPHLPGSNVKQVTAAGNSLRERAARFHATHAKESRKAPEGRDAGVIELSGSGVATVQSSPSQGTGSGSMGGGGTPHGEMMQSLIQEQSGAKRQLQQLEQPELGAVQQRVDFQSLSASAVPVQRSLGPINISLEEYQFLNEKFPQFRAHKAARAQQAQAITHKAKPAVFKWTLLQQESGSAQS